MSSQEMAFSTTCRMAPRLEPCLSPRARIRGRTPRMRQYARLSWLSYPASAIRWPTLAQTTKARLSRWRSNRVSLTLAAEATAARGRPSASTTRWYLLPGLPRSVGFGPIRSPPRLVRTLQLSTTMRQGALMSRSGPSGSGGPGAVAEHRQTSTPPDGDARWHQRHGPAQLEVPATAHPPAERKRGRQRRL